MIAVIGHHVFWHLVEQFQSACWIRLKIVLNEKLATGKPQMLG